MEHRVRAGDGLAGHCHRHAAGARSRAHLGLVLWRIDLVLPSCVEVDHITNTSLDDYVENETGSVDWVIPDQVCRHSSLSLLRPLGTYLYGRRLYETMAY